MYALFVANKNYSSWSLRPWILMRTLGIPFEEHMAYFAPDGDSTHFRRLSPTGKMPCLKEGAQTVWDSLGMVMFLAERHAGVWPAAPGARTWARCASAEMHAGFPHLRQVCSMNCGLRVRLFQRPPELMQELQRLDTLWQEGLRAHGGPFLAGDTFTAVDAFFAPVVFRIQTYHLPLSELSQAYVHWMLSQAEMQAWYTAALQETQRIRPYEAHIEEVGEVLLDERARIDW